MTYKRKIRKFHTNKRKRKKNKKTPIRTRLRSTKGKTLKGGFLSEASYFVNKVDSFFSVDPTPPLGNAPDPVPPFPYFQTK
jgi:hypothetical protein